MQHIPRYIRDVLPQTDLDFSKNDTTHKDKYNFQREHIMQLYDDKEYHQIIKLFNVVEYRSYKPYVFTQFNIAWIHNR